MKKGFTLIEIMIAVAIIAILAVIAIPCFSKYRRESQAAVCTAQRNSIRIAAEHWLSKKGHGDTAPTLSQLAEEDGTGYFKSKPRCPCCGDDYEIVLDDETNAIAVNCPYEDHGGTGAQNGSQSDVASGSGGGSGGGSEVASDAGSGSGSGSEVASNSDAGSGSGSGTEVASNSGSSSGMGGEGEDGHTIIKKEMDEDFNSNSGSEFPIFENLLD